MEDILRKATRLRLMAYEGFWKSIADKPYAELIRLKTKASFDEVMPLDVVREIIKIYAPSGYVDGTTPESAAIMAKIMGELIEQIGRGAFKRTIAKGLMEVGLVKHGEIGSWVTSKGAERLRAIADGKSNQVENPPDSPFADPKDLPTKIITKGTNAPEEPKKEDP